MQRSQTHVARIKSADPKPAARSQESHTFVFPDKFVRLLPGYDLREEVLELVDVNTHIKLPLDEDYKNPIKFKRKFHKGKLTQKIAPWDEEKFVTVSLHRLVIWNKEGKPLSATALYPEENETSIKCIDTVHVFAEKNFILWHLENWYERSLWYFNLTEKKPVQLDLKLADCYDAGFEVIPGKTPRIALQKDKTYKTLLVLDLESKQNKVAVTGVKEISFGDQEIENYSVSPCGNFWTIINYYTRGISVWRADENLKMEFVATIPFVANWVNGKLVYEDHIDRHRLRIFNPHDLSYATSRKTLEDLTKETKLDTRPDFSFKYALPFALKVELNEMLQLLQEDLVKKPHDKNILDAIAQIHHLLARFSQQDDLNIISLTTIVEQVCKDNVKIRQLFEKIARSIGTELKKEEIELKDALTSKWLEDSAKFEDKSDHQEEAVLTNNGMLTVSSQAIKYWDAESKLIREDNLFSRSDWQNGKLLRVHYQAPYLFGLSAEKEKRCMWWFDVETRKKIFFILPQLKKNVNFCDFVIFPGKDLRIILMHEKGAYAYDVDIEGMKFKPFKGIKFPTQVGKLQLSDNGKYVATQAGNQTEILIWKLDAAYKTHLIKKIDCGYSPVWRRNKLEFVTTDHLWEFNPGTNTCTILDKFAATQSYVAVLPSRTGFFHVRRHLDSVVINKYEECRLT